METDEDEDDEIIDELANVGNHGEDIRMKKMMISENFWNPYVIMQSYSPLQLLFDEIYALKQKQLAKKNELKLKNEKAKLVEHAAASGDAEESLTLSQATVSLPPSPVSPQFIEAGDHVNNFEKQHSSNKRHDEVNSSFTQF